MGHLEQATSQQMKQVQRLILSPQMQQALHLLQLPIQELELVIEEEMAQNPLLDMEEGSLGPLIDKADEWCYNTSFKHKRDEDVKNFIENSISSVVSLFDFLMEQARERFQDEEELRIAEHIIGNLDEHGFLSISLKEMALLAQTSEENLFQILKKIQTFEPCGIAACSLQESLLLQLKRQSKDGSLAFRIIENHFEDILHNRIPFIAKALSQPTAEIRKTIEKEIASLDFHPATCRNKGHYNESIQTITPDLIIQKIEGDFHVIINDFSLPELRFNYRYLQMLQEKNCPEETRQFIQEKFSSGKWLARNLQERHETLRRIARELIEIQENFFLNSMGKLVPITMKEIAERLDLHESTIARAVANKYIQCPRGILPLRSFFTHGYTSEQGDAISAKTVKDLVAEMISKEDKQTPLSDEALSALIKNQGIPCARRTVAKYRQELGIGNTVQRKRY